MARRRLVERQVHSSTTPGNMVSVLDDETYLRRIDLPMKTALSTLHTLDLDMVSSEIIVHIVRSGGDSELLSSLRRAHLSTAAALSQTSLALYAITPIPTYTYRLVRNSTRPEPQKSEETTVYALDAIREQMSNFEHERAEAYVLIERCFSDWDAASAVSLGFLVTTSWILASFVKGTYEVFGYDAPLPIQAAEAAANVTGLARRFRPALCVLREQLKAVEDCLPGYSTILEISQNKLPAYGFVSKERRLLDMASRWEELHLCCVIFMANMCIPRVEVRARLSSCNLLYQERAQSSLRGATPKGESG
ncbi:hypothetical protein OBBRIDRAFT_93090 [Obba rivulosa]|uniref:Uncharacterized protein n=1 Tax=Obba rivulosa TaxID=1052685 RepID=A0A8E2DIJ2_9APHY|nr:hypothetical protein OBBRIDRAFT_93090 [Obba rivulosa]